ncbi:MAG: NINE protein [Propionibacteriaceae bacterium]|jgi:TM2 domain-containing membrane protein YozV|nr:NINE protein [Propionibacteriaceae bacterium]
MTDGNQNGSYLDLPPVGDNSAPESPAFDQQASQFVQPPEFGVSQAEPADASQATSFESQLADPFGQQTPYPQPSYGTSDAYAPQAPAQPNPYGQNFGQPDPNAGGQYVQQPPYSQQPPYAQPQNPYVQQPPYAPYGAQPVYGEQKSKVAAGILGILVGSLGVHNFYLGYTGKAVAQLLLTLVGWILLGLGPIAAAIWGLVEGIMILTGSIKVDAKGVPLQG